jgi:hypothetical protein
MRRDIPGRRQREQGRARGGFPALQRTRAELERRFGPPVGEAERRVDFRDGVMRLECWMGPDGTTQTVRIVPPESRRMAPQAIGELAARYNGGHIGTPEQLPHVYAGGLKAWRFEGAWWAFPQKDEAGAIRGIKIWHEVSG